MKLMAAAAWWDTLRAGEGQTAYEYHRVSESDERAKSRLRTSPKYDLAGSNPVSRPTLTWPLRTECLPVWPLPVSENRGNF